MSTDASADERRLKPLGRAFTQSQSVEAKVFDSVEGRPAGGTFSLKELMVSPSMVMIEATLEKGLSSPPHQHPDHESVCYLVEGKMKVTIDGESFTAVPGDVWYNEPGVLHNLEALEDCKSIEIKSPPIKAW